jgi:hypothetical protein
VTQPHYYYTIADLLAAIERAIPDAREQEVIDALRWSDTADTQDIEDLRSLIERLLEWMQDRLRDHPAELGRYTAGLVKPLREELARLWENREVKLEVVREIESLRINGREAGRGG